jgi:hypothetical protein
MSKDTDAKKTQGYTKADGTSVFERELNNKSSFIHMIYNQLLEKAHPATKEIVKEHMIDAIVTGLTIRDATIEIENTPELKKEFLRKSQKMQTDMNSKVKSPGESLWEESKQHKKDK